ncbi:hypothetical protein LSAT2_001914 [Lamellibrachia satsuma]|nr:hypothetical protein LSAT2_001914 [Lamellibrachia satsuma]
MDSVHALNWTNDSTISQPGLNNSVQLMKTHPTRMVVIPSVAIFIVCLLGLPGNLFVLTVYLRKMTSSTRVYLFALAVADSAVCVCGIVLTRVFIDFVTVQVIICTIDAAISFSMYLLVFVSIERLLAVRRPHTFSMNALRAKKALSVISTAAVVVSSVMAVTRLTRQFLLARVFPMTFIFLCVVTMIVCYTVMAMTMLKNASNAAIRVAVSRDANPDEPGPSQSPETVNVIPTVGTSTGTNSDITTPAPPSRVTKTTAKQAKSYKGVLLVFIITVVFIACWMPQWLYYVGVPTSAGLRRIFMLNSAINPFIYSVISSMFRDDVRDFYRHTRSKLSVYFL